MPACSTYSICVPVHVPVAVDLHIPCLRRQPFIFYSSCHSGRRQLLWRCCLSNAPVSRDTRRAASHDFTNKPTGIVPWKSQYLFYFLYQLQQICYFSLFSGASWFSSCAAVCCGARRSHSASCTKLQTQRASSRHLSTTPRVSRWQVHQVKQSEALLQNASLIFNSLHSPACISSLKLGTKMQHVRCTAAESLKISSQSLKAVVCPEIEVFFVCLFFFYIRVTLPTVMLVFKTGRCS